MDVLKHKLLLRGYFKLAKNKKKLKSNGGK
jgi:hypothetical protein